MSTSNNPFSVSQFNELLLEKYQFFFTLPPKLRATAASATFISSLLLLFLIHLMLKSVLTVENLIVMYAFGVVISGLTSSMILFPVMRQFFWLTFPLSFLFGAYIGATGTMNTRTMSSFDVLSFGLALTTLILIGVSGSMWNYVIRSVVEEKSTFPVETYAFASGDRFLLFSDGVNETLNQDSEEFHIERVVHWFKHAPESFPAKELYESLSSTLTTFRGNLPLRDDSTILAVKCR
jgi:hypothetical protein